MNNMQLPLKVISVFDLYNGESAIYEVPIYQRNYAWEKEEISALVQDVYNAFVSKKENYFIGTLVSFYKGDRIYEVIDGQQRLTTVFLILHSLGVKCKNQLTYRARKKACNAIAFLNSSKEVEDKDFGIMRGAAYAECALNEIVPQKDWDFFKTFFQKNVRLVHYQVPRDIDLNHYFEIMNSRGEQLEMSEVIKARLMEKLNETDRAKFNQLWECCCEMNTYIQQKYYNIDSHNKNRPDVKRFFGNNYSSFLAMSFDELPNVDDTQKKLTISEVLFSNTTKQINEDSQKSDSFQPILDFPNFLLIVLKITKIHDPLFVIEDFVLDDKELLNQFDKVDINTAFVKEFAFNLIKAKFFLDNYIVHHSCEDDTIENNPWKLQCWKWEKDSGGVLSSLSSDKNIQDNIVHLLSMFEVSFTARQRKNYLFYCLLYLFDNYGKETDSFLADYRRFLNNLADKYFWDVYMVSENLNEINVPRPGCFDQILLPQKMLNVIPEKNKNQNDFNSIYGDGTITSKGIPLFIFNYLDYKIWLKYSDSVRGKKFEKGNSERDAFFNDLGCNDFELRYFDLFYFSRTRRSLEHYFPQANVTENGELPNVTQINCLGNYAMIGSEANSSGSNWSPKTKLDHYLDYSGKIRQVSVASLKFIIMMQICKDNQFLPERNNGKEWLFADIKKHQSKMLDILFC